MATKHCQGPSDRPIVPPAIHARGSTPRGDVRASKMGKRRAFVLIFIHVLAGLHLLHWQLSGETLSPLEPSEAMYTLRDGLVNAGAILMVVSTLSVLILGRFFCGWACHLVAVQDFCCWLLKRVGIRPRPLRSRFLTLVPMGAAFVMFGMPLIYRHRNDLGLPEFSSALTKTEFWATFPGPWLTIATFIVAGCLMVYVLGAKGFCTYACPYGGVFMMADKFAPGRIRVTDACKACGHCTAVCTSNVQVAQEIHQFGMVVDRGCMKCLDCISSCPEEALYFGLGRPALLANKKRPNKTKRFYSFALGIDATMVFVFAVSLTIFAGLPNTVAPWATALHGQTPMLFSLSLSALTAFLLGLVLHGVKAKSLKITNHVLKNEGTWTRGGRIFQLIAVLWLIFVVHSGVVQYYTFVGNRAFEAAEVGKWAWRKDGSELPQDVKHDVEEATIAFSRAQSLSLFPDMRYPWYLSWLAIIDQEPEHAIRLLKNAVRIAPKHAEAYSDLGSVFASQGQWRNALSAVKKSVALVPENQAYQRQKMQFAQQAQDLESYVEALEAMAPHTSGPHRRQRLIEIAHHRLQLGQKNKAQEAIQMLLKENPEDPIGLSLLKRLGQ